MSQPPRWTIRRTTAILAASLLLLAVAGLPAWAGASFSAPEDAVVEADVENQPLTLRVTEPEDEEYGDTARVVVTAPSEFTGMVCGEMPVGWNCTAAEDGTHLTLARTSPVALATTRDFGFTVHTSPINGQYAFPVTQADGPPNEEDPPATVSSRPALTVIGGEDPPPEPDPTPPADDGGSQTDSGSQTDNGGATSGSGSPADDPTQEDGSQDDGADSDADSDDTSSTDTTSGGSTAPRRTQGRASGTTLEIIPRESTDDDPGVAPPDVADGPAVASPGGTDPTADDDSAAVAATGAQASGEPDGTPWQQWVGAAMLLAGGAVVAIRRWGLAGRLRGLEPLELLRRWRGR